MGSSSGQPLFCTRTFLPAAHVPEAAASCSAGRAGQGGSVPGFGLERKLSVQQVWASASPGSLSGGAWGPEPWVQRPHLSSPHLQPTFAESLCYASRAPHSKGVQSQAQRKDSRCGVGTSASVPNPTGLTGRGAGLGRVSPLAVSLLSCDPPSLGGRQGRGPHEPPASGHRRKRKDTGSPSAPC